MKLYVLAAFLLVVGLGLVILFQSTPTGDGVAAPNGVETSAKTALDATQPDPATQLASGDEGLSSPAAESAPRSIVESGAASASTASVSGTVRLAGACGDDDLVEVIALSEAMSMSAFEVRVARKLRKVADPKDTHDALVLGRAALGPNQSFRVHVPEGTTTAHLMVRGRFVFMHESVEARVGDARAIVLEPLCGGALSGTIAPPAGLEGSAGNLEGHKVFVTTALELGAADPTGMGGTKRQVELSGGRFDVFGLDARTGYDVQLAPEKLAASKTNVSGFAPGRTRTVDVVLQRGGTLSGVVTTPEGGALSGAKVEARRKGQFFGFDKDVVRSATSSADGTFELGAVWPGHVLVTATADGFMEGKPLPVDVIDGGVHSGLSIALDKGKSITGLVTWNDGTPAANARIDVEFDKSQMAGMAAFNATKGAEGKARSDAQGRFAVTGLGAGPFTVRAKAVPAGQVEPDEKEAADLSASTIYQRARKDNVKPSSKDITLVLSAPIGVSGRVVDALAQPIAKFHVHVSGVGSGMLGDFGQDEVDKDFATETGAFQVELPQLGTWKLTVTSEGYAPSTPLELALPLKTDAAAIVITLQKAATVRGVVQDPRGVPVVGADVETVTGEPNWKRNLPGASYPSAKSGAGGVFELGGLVPGTITLYAASDAWAKSAELAVDVMGGETREGVVLVLREGGRLTGEIYDAGKPAVGLLVQATMLKSYDQASKISDAAGKFEITHLEPGNYQVVAMPTSALAPKEDGSGVDQAAFMSKLKMASAQIVDGQDTHVVLGAPPVDPVQVHGRVMHAERPFAGATIMFTAQGKDVLTSLKTATIATDGTYAETLDGPGTYSVTVQRMRGDMGEQSTVEFTRQIPAQKDYELDITMPTGRLSGRVRDADGAPAAGTYVQVGADGGVRTGTLFGGQYHMAATDADGRFDFEVLQPGKYAVSAGGDPFGGALGEARHARSTKNVRLDEGEWLKDVDFRLEKPGMVMVTVVDDRGSPVAEATIFARNPAGQPVDLLSMIATGADGTAKYAGLSAGRHTFSARTKDRASLESAAVDVESGETKTVKITLGAGTRLLVRVVDDDGQPVESVLSVTDANGREVANMIGMSDVQEYMAGGGEGGRDVTRVGPLAAGKYVVRAVSGGKTEEKSVTLSGQGEREVKLRFGK